MTALDAIRHQTRCLLLIARQSFLVMLTNRLRFYTGIITYVTYVAVYAAIWKAVFSSPQSAGRFAEFDGYGAVMTYIAIGWLARSFLFNNLDRDLSELIASGQVLTRCMRPISLHSQMIASALGECAFRAACFAPWIAVVLFAFFGVRAPAGPEAIAGFAIACAMAALIFAEINYLIGLVAFRTESVQGVMRAKIFLVEILSGLLIPFSYFPDWLRTAANWTPFPTLTSTPSRIYGGQVRGVEILESLAVSLAWCVILVVISHLVTKRATRQVDVG